MKSTRPEIERVLVQLKGWIRRYVLVEGLAMIVALVGVLFWLTMGIDWGYFQFSQLELPKWFRIVCLIGMLSLLAVVFVTAIISRLFRRYDASSLALVLERKFPELNDRLITAVEMTRRSNSPVETELLKRTSDEAVQKLSELELRQTVDQAPLRRMLIIASVSLASLVGFGFANAKAMERWFHAYVQGADNYWEPFRRNQLAFHVLAGPQEKERAFDEHLVYKHPRGEDLHLIASVSNQSEAPNSVRLQFLNRSNTTQRRGQVTMARTGDAFQHTFTRVSSDQQLWLRGGDYINRIPYKIQVVDPPRVDSITLKCDYPSYTGMDDIEDREVKVMGMQVSLPMETSFKLTAAVNKPLLGATLKTPRFELSLALHDDGETPLPVRLTLYDAEQATISSVELPVLSNEFWSQDRKSITVPFVVTLKGEEALVGLRKQPEFPLPLLPEDSIQISLYDHDQIESQEPATLNVTGIVDQPPVITSRRKGVGTVVTRMATIPIEGKITDDYGITDAWFAYRTQENLEEQRIPLEGRPQGRKEMLLEGTPGQQIERFNLIPLKLEVGQILTLNVGAQDGDAINGPHSSNGEMFSFQIVSQEDLLAKMFDREVSLRVRFEQVRSQVADLQKTLTEHLSAAPDNAESQPENVKAERRQVLLGYADRALHQLRRNQTDSQSVEVAFRELREEMVNNRIDTTELLERIEQRIINPMSRLNTIDFNNVDQQVALVRLAVEQVGDFPAATTQALAGIQRLLEQMDVILAEMRDRGTINDLIQGLQEMILREKKLLDQIEEKRIEDSFFGNP